MPLFEKEGNEGMLQFVIKKLTYNMCDRDLNRIMYDLRREGVGPWAEPKRRRERRPSGQRRQRGQSAESTEKLPNEVGLGGKGDTYHRMT